MRMVMKRVHPSSCGSCWVLVGFCVLTGFTVFVTFLRSGTSGEGEGGERAVTWTRSGCCHMVCVAGCAESRRGEKFVRRKVDFSCNTLKQWIGSRRSCFYQTACNGNPCYKSKGEFMCCAVVCLSCGKWYVVPLCGNHQRWSNYRLENI